MPENRLNGDDAPPLFGPPEPEVAQSLTWDDQLAYCGETNTEWITADPSAEIELHNYR